MRYHGKYSFGTHIHGVPFMKSWNLPTSK